MKKVRNRNSMHEVAIVYKRPLFESMPVIKSSFDAQDLLKKLINLSTIDLKEFFWVLLLTNSNSVLGFAQIGEGDTKGVIVNIKEIFQLVLTSNAAAIILYHNHPSGTLKVSENDRKMTEKVKNIGSLFGVPVLDHIIITSEGYYSFTDEGLL